MVTEVLRPSVTLNPQQIYKIVFRFQFSCSTSAMKTQVIIKKKSVYTALSLIYICVCTLLVIITKQFASVQSS